MNGTAEYGERVVVVEVHGGRVNLLTGQITSTDSSHVEADNQTRTVFRGDRKLHPATEIPDDSHERAFKVDDIHLLREQEAKTLGSSDSIRDWFGSIYQDYLVDKIQRALKRLMAK